MKRSLWMLLAALLFSIMAALAKAGAQDFSIFELIFYRNAFGVVSIAMWVLFTHHSLATTMFWGHIKRSFFGTMGLTIWFWALAVLPLGTGMTMNYTSPLYMALILAIGAKWKGLPLNWPLVGMVLLGFFGVTLVLRPELDSGQAWMAMVGLTSGFFAALAYFQVKELNALKEPEWRIVFYFTLFGSVWGLLGHFLLEPGFTPMTWHSGLVVLGMAVAGTLAQLCMTRSWGKNNTLLTSIFQYSGIVFAALWGQLFFDEPIVWVSALGIGLILIAGVGASWLSRRKSNTPPGTPLNEDD